MPLRLTDALIRSLAVQGRRAEIRDATVSGLVLRVTSNGAKTWAVLYRVNGIARRYTLGPYKPPYSHGDGLPLAQARARAAEILAAAHLGQDRQAEKVSARRQAVTEAQRPSPLTVERLLDECLAALDLRPRTLREWTRLARVEIVPRLGRAAAEIAKAEVRDWAEAIVRR